MEFKIRNKMLKINNIKIYIEWKYNEKYKDKLYIEYKI